MSQLLRDGAIADIRQDIAEYEARCARRTEDTIDQIRLNQGIVRGMEMAIDRILHRAANLHG